jgi:hypothetical protein
MLHASNRPGSAKPDERHEPLGEDERADCRLDELLQELRVVLPGTTVLFAFLLAVPVSARFGELTPYNRAVYFLAFGSSALALVFLLAEASYHWLRGHPYDKQVMVRTASRQAVFALALLGVALVACVALVADLVYGGVVGMVTMAALALLIATVWFGLPLSRRVRGDGDS